MTRSNDGLTLIMSSSDGFCSTLSFAPGELGQPYTAPITAPQTTGTSAQTTSTLHTPTDPTKAPAHAVPPPPASPARSNSVSSVTTQRASQQAETVVNNPTPTLGAVPLVTATHSAQPPATLPLTTPPETPLSTASQGETSNASSTVLGKRSESEKEESQDPNSAEQTQLPKKRRVAPTLISTGTDSASNERPPSTDVGG